MSGIKPFSSFVGDLKSQIGINREPRLNDILVRLQRLGAGEKFIISPATAQWLIECAKYSLLRERVFEIEHILHTLEIVPVRR